MEQPAIVERVYAAKGNSLAANDLIQDYLPFIKAETSRALGRIVLDNHDELSIAMVAFHEAVESYSKLKGAFLKYAAIIIRHKLIDFYRKEKRHMGHISLDGHQSDENASPVGSLIGVQRDDYEKIDIRDATKQEIAELTAQLSVFDISLTDIADNSPKQRRTLASCQRALAYARQHPKLIDELKRTKRLPISKLAEGAGIQRKTLERHRKYVLALLLIFSNGYEIIRGHLKQVFIPQKGGALK